MKITPTTGLRIGYVIIASFALAAYCGCTKAEFNRSQLTRRRPRRSPANCATDADCNSPACAPAFCRFDQVCTRVVQDDLCTGVGEKCTIADTLEASGCLVPPPPPPAPECVTDADCNDNVGCTADACVSGKCAYTPDDGICAAVEAGATCVIGSTILPALANAPTGCHSQITAANEAQVCDDKIDCTFDAYGSDFTCKHVPQNGKCQSGYTCDVTQGCVRNPPVCTMPEALKCLD